MVTRETTDFELAKLASVPQLAKACGKNYRTFLRWVLASHAKDVERGCSEWLYRAGSERSRTGKHRLMVNVDAFRVAHPELFRVPAPDEHVRRRLDTVEEHVKEMRSLHEKTHKMLLRLRALVDGIVASQVGEKA